MSRKEEFNFYLEACLVETLLTKSAFHKIADEPHFMTSLLGSVKDYIGEHIDSNNKADSVMNLIAPGILATTLSAMGFGWWGYLVGLAVEFFHVDIASLLKSIWSEVKQLVSGNKQTSSSQIDSIVDSNIAQFNTSDASETENQNLTSPKTSLLSDARLIKLAMIDFEKQSLKLTNKPLVSLAFSKKSSTVSMIGKIFGWILKVSLASAGLMFASDMIHKWLGQPNAIDHIKSKQTKYHSQPDTSLPKSISIENNPQNIENLLIQWTKDSYSGLDDKDFLIKSSPAFQVVLNRFSWFNIQTRGQNIILVPPEFTSKHAIVDLFIDDIANRDTITSA